MPISCRVSTCILRHPWFAFANGASWIALRRLQHFRVGFGAAILYRHDRLSGRQRNQHGHGAERRKHRHYVWSESLRLGLDNWFDTQQRIIRRIATSLNVQLSAERMRRLAGESDVSLDVHDRWLRGQSLMTKFDPRAGAGGRYFHEAIREYPSFSPCYSSLVQLNNIEHFVHPGLFRDLSKAKETLELAKTAVQLDPVDSSAHLCCGWSYVMALREAEAAPHMELACELNDNDPWTLLSGGLFHAFCGSIEQARMRAEQSLALSPAPSCLEWGYHGIIRFLAATMQVPSRLAITHMMSLKRCPLGERRRYMNSDVRDGARGSSALPQWNAFLLGRIGRSDRRGHHAMAAASASDNRDRAVGGPARQLAWRRTSCRGYRPAISVVRYFRRSR